MASITAAEVKSLRERTGAGMMDCKKALSENDGDMDAAVDWLRTKGLATAAKKAGRVAAEGLVGVAVSDSSAALVEVNSETDFVARNETFQELVQSIAELSLSNSGDYEGTLAADFPGESRTVDEQVQQMVATIGENILFRRSAGLSVASGVISSYIHNAVVPNLGKIGVLVALESTGDVEKLSALGKQIAMHVAAANPLALSVDALDPAVVERERAVLAEQARESGKSEGIIAKMTEGRLRKFYEESVLNEQLFVIDGETKIAKVIEQAADDVGAEVKLTGFVRFALGEGIEREEEDFAAEVAAQVAG
ncbi:MAG: elongation factor Ts [Alphaproteobacteria bacterium]|nr:elongation factor Ts [Alphaproteobacteria bacterium]